MAEAKLGNKHECTSCDAKFYDLGKSELVCPKCGADQTVQEDDAEDDAPKTAEAEEEVAAGDLDEDAVSDLGEDDLDSDDDDDEVGGEDVDDDEDGAEDDDQDDLVDLEDDDLDDDDLDEEDDDEEDDD